MAPRYPSIYDAVVSSTSSSSSSLSFSSSACSSSSSNNDYDRPLLDCVTLEFKPRLDLWISQSAWTGAATTATSSAAVTTTSAAVPATADVTTATADVAAMKSKKRVRFASPTSSLNQYKQHISLNEYTLQEKVDCWFNRQEFRQMRQERQQIIDRAASAAATASASADLLSEEWGLEMSNNTYTFYEIRQAQTAVLEEQDDQLRWDGRLDSDVLAARYMAYTYSSKDRAQWFGQHYAKQVAAALNSNNSNNITGAVAL